MQEFMANIPIACKRQRKLHA